MDDRLFFLITTFLAEERKSEGSWAPVTDEDMDGLHDIIERLIELKFEEDCDGDHPVEWKLINRTTHHRMHYRPLRYDHHIEDHEMTPRERIDAELNLHQAVTLNFNIATQDMERYHRHIENTHREKKRKLK